MIYSPTCILIWFLCLFVIVMGAKSGPFKASFLRVGPCANPTPPVDAQPGSYYYAELYNTSTETNLLRGNFTVIKDHRVKKIKGKSYIWAGNKWKVSHQINNMACSSVYFPALIKTTGLKYDIKTCTFAKGVYPFNGFNLNKLQHMWMSIQAYGKILWRLEVYSNTGTIFCYEYETLIEPINK